MESFFNKMTQRHVRLTMLFFFILSIIIGFSIVLTITYRSVQQGKLQAKQISYGQAEKIKYVIDDLLFTTKTVEVLLKEEHGGFQNNDELFKEIIGDAPITNIALAPNGVVTYIYPYKGNEEAIGHDLFKDPNRKVEALAAKQSGQLTLSGPFELIQGGYDVIGRQPVYFLDERGKSSFWGFVCVSLKFPEALNNANMKNLELQGYDYELWRIDPTTNKKQILMHSNAGLKYDVEETSFQLPNSTWTLSITPKQGWFSASSLIFKMAIAIFIAVLVTLLYRSIIRLTKSRYDLRLSIQQQKANYRRVHDLNEEIKSFRHDVRNHMLSLSNLLKKNDVIQAQEYINAIRKSVIQPFSIINTDNYVFDALLADKINIARSKQIQVDCEVHLQKELRITNLDWSTLFGNLLDNAIEACIVMNSDHMRIVITLHYRGTTLHVNIRNTALHAPKFENHHFISTKKEGQPHGIGLKNVEAVIHHYNGVMETSFEDGYFSVSFMLCDV